jgi:hypothetical protein
VPLTIRHINSHTRHIDTLYLVEGCGGEYEDFLDWLDQKPLRFWLFFKEHRFEASYEAFCFQDDNDHLEFKLAFSEYFEDRNTRWWSYWYDWTSFDAMVWDCDLYEDDPTRERYLTPKDCRKIGYKLYEDF